MSALHAAWKLGRAWRRHARGWYAGTTAVLAVALLLLAGTGGLLNGTWEAAKQRVEDHYTAELRVTPRTVGAAPVRYFQDADDAAGHLGPTDHVRIQMESQGILSRRGLMEAALFERDHLPVDAPGRTDAGHSQIAVGVILGFDAEDPHARSALEPYLVAGALPGPSPDGPIQVLLSLDRLERFLSPEERTALGDWPPDIQHLQGIRFELTAAHLRDNRTLAEQGLISRNAVVTGLFHTGLESLDQHTFVIPIQDARGLVGLDRNGAWANALLVSTDDPDGVRAAARQQGWAAEDGSEFAARHVGQMFVALQWAAHAFVALLFVVPAILVAHGVSRQMAVHRRELDVCRAVGIPQGVLGGSLAFVTLRMGLIALVAAALGVFFLSTALAAWLPGVDHALPLGFRVPAYAVGLALLMVGASLGCGLVVALWRSRDSLAMRLRTF